MESAPVSRFLDVSMFKLTITATGAFPYRILYQQMDGKLGVSLRWARQTSEGRSPFVDIPGSHLYTDAYMHDTDDEPLTGRVSGTFPVFMLGIQDLAPSLQRTAALVSGASDLKDESTMWWQ